VDDLLEEIRVRTGRSERVLVTTLTKRMAEDLAEYLDARGVQVRYLHSDIPTIERVEILRDLRLGTFDVLVGINLLREGLDLPEVSLVAVLDADKEGFLRSATSLIQTIGRAARNLNGTAVLYADRITRSMERAIGETDRRRETQAEYNAAHGIKPRSIRKSVREIRFTTAVADARSSDERAESVNQVAEAASAYAGRHGAELVAAIETEMRDAALGTLATLRSELAEGEFSKSRLEAMRRAASGLRMIEQADREPRIKRLKAQVRGGLRALFGEEQLERWSERLGLTGALPTEELSAGAFALELDVELRQCLLKRVAHPFDLRGRPALHRIRESRDVLCDVVFDTRFESEQLQLHRQ